MEKSKIINKDNLINKEMSWKLLKIFDDISELTLKYPNDTELGKAVREYLNNIPE